MTDSVFSSPARSWRDVLSGSLPDSENESDGLDQYLSIEISAGLDQTIISGWLKFRDQKKVKIRRTNNEKGEYYLFQDTTIPKELHLNDEETDLLD
ncbi:hypothetical protein PGB90_001222 [Kerria lacca]